jgi:tripartite ATP-independent transporter DctP family solute receptor
MKKKIIAFLLAMGMISSLAACGNSSSNNSSDSGSGSGSNTVANENLPEPGEVASGEITGDTLTISLFAGSIPENTATGSALAIMADYINAYSDGTIKAEAFYDTALGDATSMVQGLQQGTVDIGVSGTAYFSGLVPEIEVFQLPYLFEDLEAARAATSGPAADYINEKFAEVGIIGLSFWENGFRELTNNVRPVSTPDDLKGIKLRTLSSDVQVALWEALGALPTPIDASEMYTALQQGTVQGQENPLHEIVARKLYEVQPYVTLTDHVYTPFYMAISEVTWNKMSDSQKALIQEAADVAREEQLRLTDEAQATAKQELLDNGCEIVENPDKEAFKALATPTWSIFTDEYGTELLDMIQQ